MERCRVAAMPRGRDEWDKRVRALSPDHPVTSHTWSNKTGSSAIDEALEAVANFLVIFVRAFIENPHFSKAKSVISMWAFLNEAQGVRGGKNR